MTCTCGRPQANLLAEKPDADQKAVDDLTAQLKDLRGPYGQIIKAKIASLKALIKAEDQFRRDLKRSQRELVSNLRAAVEITSPDQLLMLSREELMEFVIRSGLGLAVEDFIKAEDAITQTALDTLQVVIGGADESDIPDLEALKISTADQVFQDVIIPDTLTSVRSSLQGMSVGVPVGRAMSALTQRLEQSTGTQLTQVRTQLSNYGRTVTAKAAEAYEMDLYLYTGPRDGETRSFCRPLINKVVNEKQMRQLDNGQGLPVKTSGGGYNCRHSWSPVTDTFVEAAGLDMATASDINDANRGGAR